MYAHLSTDSTRFALRKKVRFSHDVNPEQIQTRALRFCGHVASCHQGPPACACPDHYIRDDCKILPMNAILPDVQLYL